MSMLPRENWGMAALQTGLGILGAANTPRHYTQGPPSPFAGAQRGFQNFLNWQQQQKESQLAKQEREYQRNLDAQTQANFEQQQKRIEEQFRVEQQRLNEAAKRREEFRQRQVSWREEDMQRLEEEGQKITPTAKRDIMGNVIYTVGGEGAYILSDDRMVPLEFPLATGNIVKAINPDTGQDEWVDEAWAAYHKWEIQEDQTYQQKRAKHIRTEYENQLRDAILEEARKKRTTFEEARDRVIGEHGNFRRIANEFVKAGGSLEELMPPSGTILIHRDGQTVVWEPDPGEKFEESKEAEEGWERLVTQEQ
jgi:hypothetical protein